MVAAIVTAASKFLASLSYRVAIRRQSLRRQIECLFRQHPGTRPLRYFRDIRLDHARNLLLENDMPLFGFANATGLATSAISAETIVHALARFPRPLASDRVTDGRRAYARGRPPELRTINFAGHHQLRLRRRAAFHLGNEYLDRLAAYLRHRLANGRQAMSGPRRQRNIIETDDRNRLAYRESEFVAGTMQHTQRHHV